MLLWFTHQRCLRRAGTTIIENVADSLLGNRPKAVEELERALRLRDPGVHALKTDFLLDPVRPEPRFQAIERELQFPN